MSVFLHGRQRKCVRDGRHTHARPIAHIPFLPYATLEPYSRIDASHLERAAKCGSH